MSGRSSVTKLAYGEVLVAISEGIVALFKEHYGKGPTEAKTYYQDDLVLCLLRGGLTRVEKTLHQGGRLEAMMPQRMAFQEVMRSRFVAVVEQATGRQVIGFMSGYEQEPDMTCEVFILAPAPDDPARGLDDENRRPGAANNFDRGAETSERGARRI
jgi:uncharacterized protein YbcI